MWVNKVAHTHIHTPNHTGTTEQAKDARSTWKSSPKNFEGNSFPAKLASPRENKGQQVVYRSLYSNPRANEAQLASFIGKNMSLVEAGMENTKE